MLTFLTGQLAAGHSIRKVQVMKTVLSSALARAMRERVRDGLSNQAVS